MKRIYAIEKWCIDCKRCEVACKAFHSKSKDPVRAYKNEDNVPQPRIHVEGDLDLSVAINCRHCEKPLCVEGCISGALKKDPETGMVYCDQNLCVGCRTCVSMCPFGAVQVVEVNGITKAYKCDLCSDGTGEPGCPSCVAACPNGALVYVESEEGF